MLQTLIDAGADVNARTTNERTPLHGAVSTDDADLAVVQALIKAGADVNSENQAGQTPFDMVDIKKSKDVADFLRDKGAKM